MLQLSSPKPAFRTHLGRDHCRQRRGLSRLASSVRINPRDPGREGVYFVKFPFVGLERVEDVITFYGLQLPDTLTQHCAIVVERAQDQAS